MADDPHIFNILLHALLVILMVDILNDLLDIMFDILPRLIEFIEMHFQILQLHRLPHRIFLAFCHQISQVVFPHFLYYGVEVVVEGVEKLGLQLVVLPTFF